MFSFHIFFIAIVQGITEFLPISSSAHLIMIPYIMKVSDQGVLVDISVHLGSLLALIIFFKKESVILFKGLIQFFSLKWKKEEFFLLLKIIIATIPICLFGLIFKIYRLDIIVRSIELIGWTMIIFGIILFYADKLGKEKKSLKNLSFRESLFIGFFQAFALIPGVSRSGISITGFRIFGYNKYDAIKISLMMSIPTILLSAFFISPEILEEKNISIIEILIPFILSFITAFVTLKVMVRYVYVFGFSPYVIYRIFLGIILLSMAYS